MGFLDDIPAYTRTVLRAHIASMGYDHTDFDAKPVIGVVNSWNEVCPGHYPLREIAQQVKDGIREAGGVPLEFNTIALCDAFGQGNTGMRYVLPSRDIIADSIEVMVRGQRLFSGLVFVTACDKITPAMLMAAGRLDLPSLFVTSGPMNHLGTVETRERARRLLREREIGEADFVSASLTFYSGPGVCPFLGTAATMLAVAEALGMMLPGTSLIPSGTAERLLVSRLAGRRAVALVREDLRPSSIMTRPAFLNAIRLVVAVGGSLNTLIHLPAIARESGVRVAWDDFDSISQHTPFLTPVTPNGPYSVKDLYLAGGVPAVMKEIASLLDQGVVNVSGRPLPDILRDAVNRDPKVIHHAWSPVSTDGGICVLKGSLAATGAVVKKSAVPASMHVFRGPARVFDREEDCMQAIAAGAVREGDALVIRYEGPRGSPGMREMHRITELVKGRRMAIVTDGRFSGATDGLAVGYVTPEAFEGGAIAYIRDGDLIEIDIPHRRINVLADHGELDVSKRVAARPDYSSLPPILMDYQARVGSAAEGACTRVSRQTACGVPGRVAPSGEVPS